MAIRQHALRVGVLSLLAATGALSGCNSEPVVPPRIEGTIKQAEAPAPLAKAEDIVVDRAQLLQAITQAASAYAAGTDDGDDQRVLAGRRFEIAIPLGCPGPARARASVKYDSVRETLALEARPDIALDDTPIGMAARTADSVSDALQVEAVDGFWLFRPWLFSDGCPALPPPDKSTLPAGATVGIAQYYSSDSSRIGRRDGESYRTTKRVVLAEKPDARDLRLVLRGRLQVGPDARIISCNASHSAERPRCIVSVSFDRVSFENARTNQVYSEWSAG